MTPLPRLCVKAGCRLQLLGKLVDVVKAAYWVPSLVLRFIEQPQVLLAAVEVQTTDRFPVVVVHQDPAVTLGVAHHDSLRV